MDFGYGFSQQYSTNVCRPWESSQNSSEVQGPELFYQQSEADSNHTSIQNRTYQQHQLNEAFTQGHVGNNYQGQYFSNCCLSQPQSETCCPDQYLQSVIHHHPGPEISENGINPAYVQDTRGFPHVSNLLQGYSATCRYVTNNVDVRNESVSQFNVGFPSYLGRPNCTYSTTTQTRPRVTSQISPSSCDMMPTVPRWLKLPEPVPEPSRSPLKDTDNSETLTSSLFSPGKQPSDLFSPSKQPEVMNVQAVSSSSSLCRLQQFCASIQTPIDALPDSQTLSMVDAPTRATHSTALEQGNQAPGEPWVPLPPGDMRTRRVHLEPSPLPDDMRTRRVHLEPSPLPDDMRTKRVHLEPSPLPDDMRTRRVHLEPSPLPDDMRTKRVHLEPSPLPDDMRTRRVHLDYSDYSRGLQYFRSPPSSSRCSNGIQSVPQQGGSWTQSRFFTDKEAMLHHSSAECIQESLPVIMNVFSMSENCFTSQGRGAVAGGINKGRVHWENSRDPNTESREQFTGRAEPSPPKNLTRKGTKPKKKITDPQSIDDAIERVCALSRAEFAAKQVCAQSRMIDGVEQIVAQSGICDVSERVHFESIIEDPIEQTFAQRKIEDAIKQACAQGKIEYSNELICAQSRLKDAAGQVCVQSIEVATGQVCAQPIEVPGEQVCAQPIEVPGEQVCAQHIEVAAEQVCAQSIEVATGQVCAQSRMDSEKENDHYVCSLKGTKLKLSRVFPSVESKASHKSSSPSTCDKTVLLECRTSGQNTENAKTVSTADTLFKAMDSCNNSYDTAEMIESDSGTVRLLENNCVEVIKKVRQAVKILENDKIMDTDSGTGDVREHNGGVPMLKSDNNVVGFLKTSMGKDQAWDNGPNVCSNRTDNNSIVTVNNPNIAATLDTSYTRGETVVQMEGKIPQRVHKSVQMIQEDSTNRCESSQLATAGKLDYYQIMDKTRANSSSPDFHNHNSVEDLLKDEKRTGDMLEGQQEVLKKLEKEDILKGQHDEKSCVHVVMEEQDVTKYEEIFSQKPIRLPADHSYVDTDALEQNAEIRHVGNVVGVNDEKTEAKIDDCHYKGYELLQRKCETKRSVKRKNLSSDQEGHQIEIKKHKVASWSSSGNPMLKSLLKAPQRVNCETKPVFKAERDKLACLPEKQFHGRWLKVIKFRNGKYFFLSELMDKIFNSVDSCCFQKALERDLKIVPVCVPHGDFSSMNTDSLVNITIDRCQLLSINDAERLHIYFYGIEMEKNGNKCWRNTSITSPQIGTETVEGKLWRYIVLEEKRFIPLRDFECDYKGSVHLVTSIKDCLTEKDVSVFNSFTQLNSAWSDLHVGDSLLLETDVMLLLHINSHYLVDSQGHWAPSICRLPDEAEEEATLTKAAVGKGRERFPPSGCFTKPENQRILRGGVIDIFGPTLRYLAHSDSKEFVLADLFAAFQKAVVLRELRCCRAKARYCSPQEKLFLMKLKNDCDGKPANDDAILTLVVIPCVQEFMRKLS